MAEELERPDSLDLRAGAVASARHAKTASRIADYRDRQRGGLVGDVDEIKNLGGIEPQLGKALDRHFFAGIAAVRSAEVVSPQIGADLRDRAIIATLLACVGMLVYVAFRFKSWGLGAVAITRCASGLSTIFSASSGLENIATRPSSSNRMTLKTLGFSLRRSINR